MVARIARRSRWRETRLPCPDGHLNSSHCWICPTAVAVPGFDFHFIPFEMTYKYQPLDLSIFDCMESKAKDLKLVRDSSERRITKEHAVQILQTVCDTRVRVDHLSGSSDWHHMNARLRSEKESGEYNKAPCVETIWMDRNRDYPSFCDRTETICRNELREMGRWIMYVRHCVDSRQEIIFECWGREQ
jgi:hypothetical protein